MASPAVCFLTCWLASDGALDPDQIFVAPVYVNMPKQEPRTGGTVLRPKRLLTVFRHGAVLDATCWLFCSGFLAPIRRHFRRAREAVLDVVFSE